MRKLKFILEILMLADVICLAHELLDGHISLAHLLLSLFLHAVKAFAGRHARGTKSLKARSRQGRP